MRADSVPTRGRVVGHEPHGQGHRLAAALGGAPDVVLELVVPERARDDCEEVRARELAFLPEELVAAAAHGADRQLGGHDHEGGARTRQRVAGGR